MKTNLDIGYAGEEHASRYLMQKGYLILERNWRSGRNEVDIIAKDAYGLVIVEVKTRKKNRNPGPKAGAYHWEGKARPRKVTAISALRPLTAKGTATAVRYQKSENRQARARFNNPRSPSDFSTTKTAPRALNEGAAAPIRKNSPPRVRGSIEKGIPSQVPSPKRPHRAP